MLKKIALEEAVGTELAHDITEISENGFKGPAFKKGHRVCDEDVCKLQKLGKNNLYLIDLADDEIHENEAAALLAESLAGAGVVFENTPSEGRINLHAAFDGLFTVNTAALAAFNMTDEVMCATRHTNTLVKKGDLVGGTRAIPLVMKRAPVERAGQVAAQSGGILSVRPLQQMNAGLIITGSEVYNGLIKDRFAPVLKEKIEALGSLVKEIIFVPDDADRIRDALTAHIAAGCDLILISGGMSVDPDDVTRKGIQMAGARDMHYSAAVLPGAMFMSACIGSVPVLGIPACALHHRATVLDLVLPRILAGQKVGKKELALMGHGGLCLNCTECGFPDCSFGLGC